MKQYFYPLALSSWSDEETNVACDVIKSQQTTMGRHVSTFERNFSDYLGCHSSYMVNSGSSANLLMASALKLYLDIYGDSRNTVLIPAVGWSTSYAPFIQLGFNVRVIDVSVATFNLEIDGFINSVDDDVVAILAVNILGNPAPLFGLKRACQELGIFLLEDNCESLGAEIQENSINQKAGSFGIMSTHSFFFSHHINTMEGGCVSTSSHEFSLLLKVLRNHGWAREINDDEFASLGDSPVFNWFSSQINELKGNRADFEFMRSFYFLVPGFNLRPTEVQGALGVLQLQKLPDFVSQRRKNASLIRDLVSCFDFLEMQSEFGRSSYFGFGFILDSFDMRSKIVSYLDSNGVQVRPIVSGSIAMHPLASFMDSSANLSAADVIHRKGFFVGNHHIDYENNIVRLVELISNFKKQF